MVLSPVAKLGLDTTTFTTDCKPVPYSTFKTDKRSAQNTDRLSLLKNSAQLVKAKSLFCLSFFLDFRKRPNVQAQLGHELEI